MMLLLLLLQGDFDLMRNWENARFMAPLFSIVFVVFMVILMFNFLIAVMTEEYEEVSLLQPPPRWRSCCLLSPPPPLAVEGPCRCGVVLYAVPHD